MIDHIYLPVSDLKRSSEFYKKLLEPLDTRQFALLGRHRFRKPESGHYFRIAADSPRIFGLNEGGWKRDSFQCGSR
jgi:catechol 2,3-dioxygenase-like lactoylglutathione lyase family enzyme